MPIIPAGDLTTLRSEPSRSKLFLVVQQPCRYDTITGFETDDMVWFGTVRVAPIVDPITSIAVTADVGAPNTTLRDGMTILISNVAGEFGLWDRAVARVHGDQTILGALANDTLYVHVSSDLSTLSVGDHIAVVDEHRFWTRYPKVEGPAAALIWYKDFGYFKSSLGAGNLSYTWIQLGANDAQRRQASMPTVPIMGPHAVKFIDPAGSVNVNFDWSDSYTTAPGTAVDTWTSWGEINHVGGTWNSVVQVPGAQNYTTISGLRGFRTVLEVACNGIDPIVEFRRGTRYVFTLRRPGQAQASDPEDCYPITDFELQDCSGSFDSGGWRGRVRIFGPQAHEYNIQPGALCILFSDDWYGVTHESVAPDDNLFTDRENIVMCGYVGDGNITQDSETGDVSFDVLSLSELMKTRENYPVPIENNDLATTWYQTPDLTIDRAAHHYLTWHTNLKQVTDVFQTGDTREIAAMDFLAGDCYSAVDTFINDRIFARLLCNRFGQVKMDIDRDMEAAGSGATLFTFQDGDQITDFTADEINESPVSIIDLGGVYWNAGAFTPMLSHAPGVVSRYWGNPEASMSLAIASQAQLNILAGRLLAYRNNRFPRITVPMRGNWRVFDIWPQEYIDLSKVTWRYNFEGKDIVRDVSFEHDAAAGAMFTTVTCAAETNGPAGMTIIIPDDIPIPKPKKPPTGDGGPGEYEDSGRRIMSTGVGVVVTDNIGSVSPHWYLVNDGLTAGRERCWKIIRDPWHWWTSGGTERTLWGIFSRATTGMAYYIYKMTDFPYGTWTEMYSAATVPGAGGGGDAPFVADIVGSIESDGLFYAIVNNGDAFGGSGSPYVAKTVNAGVAWTHSGAVSAGSYPPEWAVGQSPPPFRKSSIDLGAHSAGQMIYVALRALAWEPNVHRSLDGYTTWATIALSGFMGNFGALRMHIPYVSPSWADTLGYLLTDDSSNNVTGIARSANLKAAAAAVTWSQRGCPLAGGDALTKFHRWFDVCFDNPDHLALLLSYAVGATEMHVVTSDDAGVTWTDWVRISAPHHCLSSAAFFTWNSAQVLESVLCHDYDNSKVWLITPAGAVDKTGDLYSIAPTLDYVTMIDRDTMGAA